MLEMQDVLAALDRIGVDPEQREQSRRDRADLVAHGLGVGTVGRRCERPEHRDGKPGIAAGRVDRELGRVAQPLDARAVLAPVGKALRPQLRLRLGVLVGSDARLGGVVLVDPGAKVGGRERRERQHQIREVALGVDHDRGHAVERGLLDHAHAEAGLARTGHAHAHGVRGQVLRVVEDVAVLDRLGLGVVLLAEVEAPQPFDSVHNALPALAGRASLGRHDVTPRAAERSVRCSSSDTAAPRAGRTRPAAPRARAGSAGSDVPPENRSRRRGWGCPRDRGWPR